MPLPFDELAFSSFLLLLLAEVEGSAGLRGAKKEETGGLGLSDLASVVFLPLLLPLALLSVFELSSFLLGDATGSFLRSGSGASTLAFFFCGDLLLSVTR